MKIALVSGSGGLVGSEACKMFSKKFDLVIGIDNNQRKFLFGEGSSINDTLIHLEKTLGNFRNYDIDIRDTEKIEKLFRKYNSDIKFIIHTAAQPSHDWSSTDVKTDFEINAIGTMNLLENTRKFTNDAIFIFTSTNKVYGDHPNYLPYHEEESRWEINPGNLFNNGIDETMSLDSCIHSPFGVSKTSADLMVQEYGRYFDLNTVIFRAGCITGPNHKGAELHGFLAYLLKCIVKKITYTIYGYKGKQVRDNLHSYDLISAFDQVLKYPEKLIKGNVYNIGGGREVNCSVLEAIKMAEEMTGEKLNYKQSDIPRIGDHKWWITDTGKFERDYPDWKKNKTLTNIILEIVDNLFA